MLFYGKSSLVSISNHICGFLWQSDFELLEKSSYSASPENLIASLIFGSSLDTRGLNSVWGQQVVIQLTLCDADAWSTLSATSFFGESSLVCFTVEQHFLRIFSCIIPWENIRWKKKTIGRPTSW